MAYSQNTFKAVINDADNKPLQGAVVSLQGTGMAATSDTLGYVTMHNIPNGRQVLKYQYTGYVTRFDTLIFPLSDSKLIIITLDAAEAELDEVVVTATRSTRTITNIPTRIEVIAGEELDEKGNMKPGDIRMVLAESTGIQTQQTSATSGNASIRIQGLDGKYTQIIRDGFPLYAGFSGGLGLLQIAPLDLKQVEVIKGSSSTLYGGGAIAGLVNLVSKTPTSQRQLNVLLNGTSARGLDASMFYAEKFKKTGATIYAAYNHGTAYDPSGTDLTAIPQFDRITLNPKMFFYMTDRTTLTAGINATTEHRLGGDLHYIKGNADATHAYFEENKTGRYSTQVQLTHSISSKEKLVLKNSVSYYDRSIALPAYRFSGDQISSYSEASYLRNGETGDWVAGINYLTDKFSEDANSSFPLRSYHNNTFGAFVQNTWDISRAFTLETGVRADQHSNYGFMFLPRASALWKISPQWSTRLGGGLGYKAPNVFTEESERIQFRNVLPLDITNTRAERSYGANYDVNYRTAIFGGGGSFSVNQLFFYTRVNNPILLTSLPNGNLQYRQPAGDLNTRGLETNVKVTYSRFKLFIGYTYADVSQHTGTTISEYTLVSKHRLNNVLMYEIEDKWKVGAEAYYFSRQKLNDGATGKPYWTAGLMAERIWERFSLFINFENLTDTRQTRFDTIYTGTVSQPVFRDIYAPLDGFVINGGVKLKL
jgi:iron complex outermembrane receptor protein